MKYRSQITSTVLDILCLITLENHCTRTAQSSRGGCSRVHKIVYPAVKRQYFGQVFTSENSHRELLSLINPAVYLLNKFFVG